MIYVIIPVICRVICVSRGYSRINVNNVDCKQTDQPIQYISLQCIGMEAKSKAHIVRLTSHQRHEGEFSGLKSGEARLKCTDEPQPSNPSNHNHSPNEIGDICQHSMQCALSKLQKTYPASNNWSSLSSFQMLRTTKRFYTVFV